MVKLFLLVILIIKYAFSNENVDLTYKNNYYILLSSSKFYFNQRHSTNVMIFY
jgi:glycosylphosphatidylinositol transamidase (GPIT) subunit GPI8